ncbi:MAG: hypothetical protein ACI4QM_04185, partial [Alphaproteobacteria bacterium]
TFSDPVKENDSIYLQISGLPERVCEMVAESLGEQFDLDVNGQQYGDNHTSLCGDDNTIRIYFEETGAGVTCNPACGAGEICVNGICVDEEMQPGSSASKCSSDDQCPECQLCSSYGECDSYQPNGTACTGGTCSYGKCVAGECSSNSDCSGDFFCAGTNISCTQVHPGICQKLNFTRRTITVNGTSEIWYMSSGPMSWWDVQSACNKIGKTMVTVDELIDNWNGTTGTKTRTERAQKLSDAIGGDPYVWTSDIDPSNSCNAFSVDLSNGNVNSSYYRSGYFGLALCH